MKIKILLLSLYPKIRKKIGQQLPIQIALAKLLLEHTSREARPSRLTKSECDLMPDSYYFLETNCWKKFVIGQMLKNYLITKTSVLL